MVSGEIFDGRIAEFQDANTKVEDDGLVCGTCGSEIQGMPASISVHDSPVGGCAGFGEVKVVQIPYCPKCEDEPRQSGCVHP